MSVTDAESSLLAIDPREFKLFRALIHHHTGIWLRDGKEVMMASRLSKRLRHHHMTSFADYYKYVEYCRDGGEELKELINCVTTNKTSFFREQHHFDYLAKTVLPQLTHAASGAPLGGNTISIWCAASSTGEEPYSIAITLLEFSALARSLPPGQTTFRVTASDIDTAVLNTATQALYPCDALLGLPQDIQKKYFLKGTGQMAGRVKVKKQVTDMVQFQRINLMENAWPLTSKFDAIFFRNALIYFQQETQDVFLRKMARLLKPGGYLFLGHSENIPWLHDVFKPLNKTIYRLQDAPR